MNPVHFFKKTTYWIAFFLCLSIALSAQDPHLSEDGDEYFFSQLEYDEADWIEDWEEADALRQAFWRLSAAELSGLPDEWAHLRRRGQRQRWWLTAARHYRQSATQLCIETGAACLILRWDREHEQGERLVVEILNKQPDVSADLVFLKKISTNKRF